MTQVQAAHCHHKILGYIASGTFQKIFHITCAAGSGYIHSRFGIVELSFLAIHFPLYIRLIILIQRCFRHSTPLLQCMHTVQAMVSGISSTLCTLQDFSEHFALHSFTVFVHIRQIVIYGQRMYCAQTLRHG